MHKRKVLFILHLPPPVHGAAMVGEYILKSEIINDEFNARYINLGISESINEIGKGGRKKILRYLKLLNKAVFAFLKNRPDLVYLSLTAKGVGFYKDAFLVLILKLLGAKVVYHFHNKGIRSQQDKFFDDLLYKAVFKNSYVILLSKYLYMDVEKYVSKDRVLFCANGIPEKSKKLEVYSNFQNTKPIKILFLSNLIESKGVFILIEACRLLKEKSVPFHCTLVGGEGDISSKSLKTKIEENNLSEEVHYVGKKYDDEKFKILADSDVFVLPTFYTNECFPLVLLEAMQFSLPIISTNEGGIPEIVENEKSGYIVSKKGPEPIFERLDFLIKNPKMIYEMGTHGRKKYEEEFTLKAFENKLTTILKGIA